MLSEGFILLLYFNIFRTPWLVIIHCKSEAFPHRSSSDTETWMALLQLLRSTTSALFRQACKHPTSGSLTTTIYCKHLSRQSPNHSSSNCQFLQKMLPCSLPSCTRKPSTFTAFRKPTTKVHTLRQAVPVGSFVQAI